MTQLQDQSELISSVVSEVLKRLDATAPGSNNPGSASPASANGPAALSASPGDGLFAQVEPAVQAAERAQRQLDRAGMAVRDGIVKLIKRIAADNARHWGQFELNETKVGRLDHKIAKLELLQGVPGVEFLKTAAHSGDDGVGLDEPAPFGVIGVITPVTHSIPTMTANAINMIAAGNSMVVNPHPSGAKSADLAAAA